MIELVRKENWQSLLFSAIEERRDTPFKWGFHDCALFAAYLVEVMTGTDLAAEFRGHYDTQKGALKALKTIGSGDLKATVTNMLGEPINHFEARRGDLVLLRTETEPSLAIVVGAQAVGAATNGIELRGMEDWLCAWSIGE